jgi:hypothetical protein
MSQTRAKFGYRRKLGSSNDIDGREISGVSRAVGNPPDFLTDTVCFDPATAYVHAEP